MQRHQVARRIAGGKRVKAVKQVSEQTKFGYDFTQVVNRFNNESLTDIVSMIKLGDKVITATKVCFFRESKCLYIETPCEQEHGVQSEQINISNRYQRRLFEFLVEKGMIKSTPINCDCMKLQVLNSQWRINPVSLFYDKLGRGVFCFGEVQMLNGSEIEFMNKPLSVSNTDDATLVQPESEIPELIRKAYASDGTYSQEDLDLLMNQTNCSREEAIIALENNKNDIVEAIMALSS